MTLSDGTAGGPLAGPGTWARIKEIFQAALEQPAEEREAYVLQACLDHPELLGEVRSLLASHEESEPFLDASAVEDMGGEGEAELEGRRIGPYRVLRQIGRGGMGSVYLARRDDAAFQKEVALKLIRPKAFGGAGEQMRQRFLAERQILADLDHPNIARLLDGGSTDEGVPYLVMEHVDGIPIDVYCDSHRLSVRQRLELLRTVCSAVHYAHQNLIVHRDLKPSNLLVTPEGVPKLLDFGIAKLLDPEGRRAGPHTLTRTGMGPMTPEYASPEQLLGQPVSTVSDVYALGVVAYRLLTGYAPYRVDSRRPAEMIRSIVEVEPRRPSERFITHPGGLRMEALGQDEPAPWDVCKQRGVEGTRALRRSLEGDLDNILMKALRKDPRGRYASANQLSEEIYRHLTGLPVEVRGDHLAYRVRKWVSRNRALAVACGLSLAVLLGSVVVTTRMAQVASGERAKAEARFAEVRELAGIFIFDLHDEIQDLPGSTRARGKLVEVSLDYLDRLSSVPGGDGTLQREQAEAYRRIGDIQGQTRTASLGDTSGALGSYRNALDLYTELGEGEGLEAADLRGRISEMLSLQGDWRGATAMAKEGRAVLSRLVVERPGDLAVLLLEADSLDRLGRIAQSDDRREEALEIYRQALSIRQELAEQYPSDPEVERAISISTLQIGDALVYLDRLEEAAASYQQTLEIHRRRHAADPENTETVTDLMAAHERMGEALQAQGDLSGARASYLASSREALRLVEADPFDAQSRRNLSIMRVRLGDIATQEEDYAAAQREYQAALELRRELLRGDPSNARSRRDVGVALYKLGLASKAEAAEMGGAARQHLFGQAKDWFARSLEEFEDMESRGQLAGADGGATEELRNLIDECEASLSSK